MRITNANHIKDPLAWNLGYVEAKNHKLTCRLPEIRGHEESFKRRDGSVWLVSRKALLALHPVRGQ